MKPQILLCVLLILCGSAGDSNAQLRASKATTGYLRFLEGNVRRFLPGRPESEPVTEHRFLVRWMARSGPQSFFWKQGNTWQDCRISRARRMKYSNKDASSRWYDTEDITPEKVRRGDTLEIFPMAGGKFAIPAKVPRSVKNALVFRTGKNKWQYLPVTRIKTLPDVTMP
jgi:hypothetical protein